MRRGTSGINALIAVDKPAGMTSHDVVARVRRALGERRVGHAGTLDPDATGVLVVGVGQGTRLMGLLTAERKGYVGLVAFGSETDTEDAAGAVTRVAEPPAWALDDQRARACVEGLVGEHDQVPPAYSAISVGGIRSYARARAGEQVELAPRRVTIYDAQLLSVGASVPGVGPGGPGAGAGSDAGSAGASAGTDAGGAGARVSGLDGTSDPACPDASERDRAEAGEGPAATAPAPAAVTWLCSFDVSKGCYVRSIARDLGRACESAAHLAGLRRTRSGAVTLGDCVSLDGLEREGARIVATRCVDPVRALALPVRTLGEREAADAANGKSLALGSVGSVAPCEGDRVALVCADRLVGVWKRRGDRLVCDVNFPGGITGVRQ